MRKTGITRRRSSLSRSSSTASALTRKKKLLAARKPLKKSNPERQAKVAKRSKAKHAAFLKSEARRLVDKRAGDRCERTTFASFPGGMGDLEYRCSAVEDLEYHHTTYARYGGNELPTDVLKVCKRCHEWFESQKPAGNRRSRASTPSRSTTA